MLLAFCSTTYAQQSENQPALPSSSELETGGAVVGEIFIDARNIFDIADPKEDNFLFRTANRLHIKTREHVIRQQLLFHPGERYSQSVIDESERILRSDRYLYDASIRPVAYHDGVVDIAVTTHDVWTLNPGVSFGRSGGKSTAGFELEELNFFGTGVGISASHKSSIDRSSNAIEYRDRHVAGSWVSLDAKYASNSDGSTREFTVDRPFYSLNTPWSLGVAALDDDRIESLYDLGNIIDQFRARERSATLYGGWSRGLVDGWVKRWTLGMSFEDELFSPSSTWSGTAAIPADQKFVYPVLGFELIQDDFIKARNHDQIGRTEDFLLGAYFGVKLGWAAASVGSDRNAMLFNAKASYGLTASRNSTLLFDGELTGRLEKGGLRDAVLKAAARYYVEQSKRALFFATLETATARNLDLDTQILLGGDNGLRGYPLRYQSGASRALLTVEQRYFTDWYPFRLFRIGGAAFVDIGRTWGRPPMGGENLGLLKDVGIGLRIGNSRSGLGNIIHIDLAFPLDGDKSISNVQLLVETKQKF